MAKIRGLKAKVEAHPRYGVPGRIYDIETKPSKQEPAQIAESLLKKIARDLQINPDLSQLKFDQVKQSILGQINAPAVVADDSIESLHELAHDAKGQGGSFGYPLATLIAASLCRLLHERSLFDQRVTVVGGGGIAAELLRLLGPFRVDVTIVRQRPEPLAGASRTVGDDRLLEALAGARAVVLALALTPHTRNLIGPAALAAMDQDAWLVNVARGGLVDTAALLHALRSGQIGGAALDVTDPEPLPAGHPLWDLPNCLITPHTADTEEMTRPLLANRIAENVRRLTTGQELVGRVDPDLGY